MIEIGKTQLGKIFTKDSKTLTEYILQKEDNSQIEFSSKDFFKTLKSQLNSENATDIISETEKYLLIQYNTTKKDKYYNELYRRYELYIWKNAKYVNRTIRPVESMMFLNKF